MKFQLLAKGLALHISNIDLQCFPEDKNDLIQNVKHIKVWLDKGEGVEKQSRLLATLRPKTNEQYFLSTRVTEIGTIYCLRLEANVLTDERVNGDQIDSSTGDKNFGFQVLVKGVVKANRGINIKKKRKKRNLTTPDDVKHLKVPKWKLKALASRSDASLAPFGITSNEEIVFSATGSKHQSLVLP